MQTKVGVSTFVKAFFLERKVNANNSFGFDRKVEDVVVKAANYPKFSKYFKNKFSYFWYVLLILSTKRCGFNDLYDLYDL